MSLFLRIASWARVRLSDAWTLGMTNDGFLCTGNGQQSRKFTSMANLLADVISFSEVSFQIVLSLHSVLIHMDRPVHQSGELETLLEKSGIIPPVEEEAKSAAPVS